MIVPGVPGAKPLHRKWSAHVPDHSSLASPDFFCVDWSDPAFSPAWLRLDPPRRSKNAATAMKATRFIPTPCLLPPPPLMEWA
ncbi:MAG: hypothetical protein E6G44_02125 [Actinobacteria bacterium]|nr:MAG: hypothetical protein E6G44_02125 [Actinomycetota bacterium]